MSSNLVAIEYRLWARPEPKLTKAEETEVKKVGRELLEKLKREKLVLDWRENQQARAAVMQTLKLELRRLPPAFPRKLRAKKMAPAYAHVYDRYGAHARSFDSP